MKRLPLNTNIRTGFTRGNLVGWLSLKTKTECIDTRHIKNIPNLLQSFLANTLTVSHDSLVNSEKSTGNTS